jgi:alpha-glucosidase
MTDFMRAKEIPAAMLRASRLLCLTLCLLAGCSTPAPQPQSKPDFGPLTLLSPDGKIQVNLSAQGALTYALNVDGHAVLANSRLGLAFHDGTEIGADSELLNVVRGSSDNSWENRFGKHRQVRNHYNELRLELREKTGARNFEVVFRAFDDGIGFRYVLPLQPGFNSFTVDRELTEFAFPANCTCFAGQQTNGFKGSQEWEFQPQPLADIQPDSIIGLPLLIKTPVAWVALTESDLRDWSGMWIGGKTESSGAVTLSAKLAPRREGDGLVRASTPHDSPWRALIIGREPGRLIESDLVLNFAAPCELADTSWVKPGMMAWDHWWSGDVKMDTATIKQYIQLASDMGWPYQLIDWQWYGPFNKPNADITHVNPALDMDEVRRFASEKNVRLWLWLYWTDADRNDAYEKAFALYEQWGIAGIKIDFMDSDDQFMVNWYEKLTRAAAAHHLMINFHGAFKPTGLNRTFPNQITREGVLGNEYNRWSTRVTPEHKLTLPFTRFLAGPGDFTPGGFLNRQPSQFKASSRAAEVQGTRAAQLALFVVYDSPICCVCDHPDHYREQPGADFLKIVPTVWDDTRVPDGEVAKHLVMVRRSGDDWFLGALTDSNAREIPVKLDFLGPGRWKLRLWKDAADSNINAEHLEVEERVVSAGDTLHLQMAPAGGAVARFQKE